MTARDDSPKRIRPVIAIDGPVGAGKSVAARALARELGFRYVNTGAMYRAFAIKARSEGIRPDDSGLERKIEPILKSLRITFDGERLLLDGKDIAAELSEPEVGDLASRFSTIPSVRARMRELQRAAGQGGGVVMEGRDIGTVVFPDAEFKFFLDADVKVRANRRYAELRQKGVQISLEEVLEQLIERDRRDRTRELAPLVQASDAVAIDATSLAVGEVVGVMKEQIEKRSDNRRA